jgi:NADPH2:quinone reductase
MRAVVCHELKGVDGVRYETDWPEPEMNEGQVLVDVHSSALNFPDLLMIHGMYQEKPELPFVAGTEMAGVVRKVGSGVTGVAVGDRVVAVSGRTLAERVAIDAPRVLRAPRGLDFDQACGIGITYFTSMHALRQRAQLQAGETLLVLGAAGGVGVTAIQLGKIMGATVIAAASSEDKLTLAKELGADATIDYSREDLRERLKALTSGRGVDVVYDPVGGQLAEPALRSMAWRGRYLVVGFASGQIPSLPFNLTLLKGCSIVGVFWGSFAQRERAVHLQNVAELWGLFESGRLLPVVGEVHPLENYRDAFAALAARRARGKIVVRVQT